MLSLFLALGLLAAPQGSSSIVINEFSYDDSSTDDMEFVELYNPTSSPVDISGWVLESTDTATPDNNPDYTIPASTILAPGAYYVLGSALVPNVDLVVGTTNLWENSNESLTLRDATGKIIDTLVYEANKGWPAAKASAKEGEGVWANFTGISSTSTYLALLKGANEVPPVATAAFGRAVINYDSTTKMVDIRVLVSGVTPTAAHLHQGAKGVNGGVVIPLTMSGGAWTGSGTLTAAQETAFLAGDTYINVHSAANPGGEIRGQAMICPTTSFSRHSGDTDDNGDDFALMPSTPGISNALYGNATYSDNYDAAADESVSLDFQGSFAAARVIDPTMVSTTNPNAIVASPQGGKALAMWDSSGGGNTCVFNAGTGSNAVFEAYVYLDNKTVPAGETETWSIGFGTTGTFYNTPDPGGTLSFTANGNTGISWTYQNLDSGATLYLVDHNNGGQGANAGTQPMVLAKIALTAANSGWQRLRLEINGNTGVASFGGTLGCADGDTYAFSTDMEEWPMRTLYFGYREFLTSNATARPITLDAVNVDMSTSDASLVGTAKATTVATPAIAVGSPATIGNSKFTIELSGLVPSSAGIFLFGSKLATPLDLSTIGGQTGSNLYALPSVVFGVVNDAQGMSTVPVPIPCDMALLGAKVVWQDFDIDPALSVAFKVGNTPGLETTVGN